MKQHIETKLGVVIILIFAVTVGAFVWKWEKNQSEVQQPQIAYNIKKSIKTQPSVVNQENNTQENKQAIIEPPAMESVSFCGKSFETNMIKVGTTNLVKRIAEIATNNPENRICENIITNSPEGKISSNVEKQKDTDVDYKDEVYFANISIMQFKVDAIQNNIYTIGAFDGKATLIGKLR